jgi:hypothetical protein
MNTYYQSGTATKRRISQRKRHIKRYCPAIGTGERDLAHSINCNNLEAWQVMLTNFNDKILREEPKPIQCGLN